MYILNEDSRRELVAKSKQGNREKDGKTRYEKRVKSKVSSSTKEYNRIDMNQFFKQDILTISISVKGETDNYLVKLSFSGVLNILQEEVKRNNNNLELKNIIKALVISFNKNDVYIHCTCPDFKYRFSYWATIHKTTSGEPELIPADETNPDDNLGPACKHILLVLSNTSWIIKVASVINNYINYMKKYREKLYTDIIYPTIYNKKYEKPVQLSIDNSDELDSDSDIIDKSNNEAKTKNQFKPGNPYRFTKKLDSKNQLELDLDNNEEV